MELQHSTLLTKDKSTNLHHLSVVLHPRSLQSFHMMPSAVVVNKFPTSFGHTSLKSHFVSAFGRSTCQSFSSNDKLCVTFRSGNCSRYSSKFSSVESTSLLWKSSHNASQSCRKTHTTSKPLKLTLRIVCSVSASTNQWQEGLPPLPHPLYTSSLWTL